jgi:hypothetical protein
MTMARNLAVWLVALTVAGMMMAMALAGAAHARAAAPVAVEGAAT